MKLSHLDDEGHLHMVDVSSKPITPRHARARGAICLKQSSIDAIAEDKVAKGDVFATARIAGITAAKRVDELIPLCHSIPLDSISVDLEARSDPPRIEISADVTCIAKTGAEMEALTAVSVAALTIYDMVKAIDKTAVIGDIRLVEKSGGKSGHFVREEDACKEE